MQDTPDWRSAPHNVYSTVFKIRMVKPAQLTGAYITANAHVYIFNRNIHFRGLRLWQREALYPDLVKHTTSLCSDTFSHACHVAVRARHDSRTIKIAFPRLGSAATTAAALLYLGEDATEQPELLRSEFCVIHALREEQACKITIASCRRPRRCGRYCRARAADAGTDIRIRGEYAAEPVIRHL